MAFYPLTVTGIEPLCDDAAAVTVVPPPEHAPAFAFAAGQSLTLRRTVDGVEHRRSYSICSPAGGPVRIGVRRVEHGALSPWLVGDLRVGDVIEAQPPTGSFALPPDAGGRHVLLAAGSGITR